MPDMRHLRRRAKSLFAIQAGVVVVGLGVLLLALLLSGRPLSEMDQVASVIGAVTAVIAALVAAAAWLIRKIKGQDSNTSGDAGTSDPAESSSTPSQTESPGPRAQPRPNVLLRYLRDPIAYSIVGLVAIATLVIGSFQIITGRFPSRPAPSANATPAVTVNVDTASPQMRVTPSLDAFRDVGCFYDVTNDSAKGAAPHQIKYGGEVRQNFVAQFPFIRAVSLVIGHGPTPVALSVRVRLLEGSKVIGKGDVPIENNRGSRLHFEPPIPVNPGTTYTIQMQNLTGHTLGVYMYRFPRVKPEHIGRAIVIGEVDRASVSREEALTGCVEGATPK